MIIDGILLALYTSYLNSGLDWGRGRSFLKTTEERERERKKVVGDNILLDFNPLWDSMYFQCKSLNVYVPKDVGVAWLIAQDINCRKLVNTNS